MKTEGLSRDELIQGLQKDFPNEAFYTYTVGDKKFTGLYVQYLIDRLNALCGVGEWEFEHEIIQKIGPEDYSMEIQDGVITRSRGYFHRHAVVRGRLHLPYWETKNTKRMMITTPYQFGGNANEDIGDAYKGAVTDCMIKCSQFFEVAKEMYKEDDLKKSDKSVNKKVNDILTQVKGGK